MTSTVAVEPYAPDATGRPGESFATLLAYWARTLGDQTALTHLDHVRNPDGHAVTLSWRQLDERVSAVALRLRELAAPGERAAVLVEQSVDYVVAFLGALRAGCVAVPLFPPSVPGHAGRLESVLADCAPAVALTTTAGRDAVRSFVADRAVEMLAVDGLEPVRTADHSWHHPDPDEIAYLQYTSGSTRAPAGVVLTHHNVVSNARQAQVAYGLEPQVTSTVSWLPLFHDMGLILGIGGPVTVGAPALLLDPLAFLEKPVRWLQALSASPGAVTAAPSFAYAYAAARVSEAEASYLELSRVVSLIDGSEPVQPGAIARFLTAFEPSGLRPEAHRPSYGLAEATVLVSAAERGRAPRVTLVDRDLLAAGRAVPAGASAQATALVSCGRPIGQTVRIVDPLTGTGNIPARVGEVWVSGDNVGQTYWGRGDDGTFGRRLDGDDRTWLATGDLGVLLDGELYITGRMKDLIIVDGRNHYPQDIEQTVEEHPAVRRHSAGAFAVPGDGGEIAVLVVERARGATTADVRAAAPELRRAVAAEHGLTLRDVVVLEPGEVPRTSSGKISRARCRAGYLDGTLAGAS